MVNSFGITGSILAIMFITFKGVAPCIVVDSVYIFLVGKV